VGKTTVVNRVAAGLQDHQRITGFVTDEVREQGRRVGFRIRPFGGEARTLAHVDIRSRHRVGRYAVDVGALDEVVQSALVLDDATDLYVVDEIGKMECFSRRFEAAIVALLDARRPLVATIALHGGGFIAAVKQRSDVTVWQVTKDNREEVPERIRIWLSEKRSD